MSINCKTRTSKITWKEYSTCVHNSQLTIKNLIYNNKKERTAAQIQ